MRGCWVLVGSLAYAAPALAESYAECMARRKALTEEAIREEERAGGRDRPPDALRDCRARELCRMDRAIDVARGRPAVLRARIRRDRHGHRIDGHRLVRRFGQGVGYASTRLLGVGHLYVDRSDALALVAADVTVKALQVGPLRFELVGLLGMTMRFDHASALGQLGVAVRL